MSEHRDERRPRHPRFPRRAFLEAGAVGILGLGMGELAALRAAAAAERGAATGARNGARAHGVIYIFLSGGLSQHESFDLKPDAPDGFRGEFRPIPTATPGIEICEHLPLLARRSGLWALVRSLTHPYNDHSQGHHVMLTGRTPLPAGFDGNQPRPGDWPSVAAVSGWAAANGLTAGNGAAAAAVATRGNLPPAVVLPHALIHRTGRVIPGQGAGALGARWDPWLIRAAADCRGAYGACPQCFHHETGAAAHTAEPVFQAPSLTLPEGLDGGRIARRLALLGEIERQQRALEGDARAAELDRHRAQAVSLLAGGRARAAFDVLNADPRTLERYRRNQFGWSLLMARRLVETGVSLVQVNLGNNETWDTHQAAFPNLREHLLPPLDLALSALLDDLEASGLLREILVVVGSEFGRTPRVSKLPGAPLAGRDHWGLSQTVLLAGGGVRGGVVVGATDRIGARPSRDPQTPENLAATIYEALGIPRTCQWQDLAGRPHPVYGGDPIEGLA